MSCPFLIDLWRDLAGLPPVKPVPVLPSLSELRKSEWSPKFETLMRNRLIMGAIRYGLLHDKEKKRYDRIQSIQKRLDLYKVDGNLEHLVDSANLCLMEFEEGNHPKKHFKAIDDGHHTKEVSK